MQGFLSGFDAFIAIAGRVLFGVSVLIAIACALDWAVRTRRINPFGGVARFLRNYFEPVMRPVERRVVSAGGLPASAPWWTLVFVVVGAILLLAFLRFVRDQIAYLGYAGRSGGSALIVLLIGWTFNFLKLALFVRVISSWIRVSPYSVWVNWSFRVTEPLLAPLRRIVPPLGMIDITPLVAFFVLYVVESLLYAAIG